jgi:uncharacterized protein (DUF433 family)
MNRDYSLGSYATKTEAAIAYNIESVEFHGHSPGCSQGVLRYPGNGLNSRRMSYADRITIEPGKCGGRPCIRGYRMRVKDVLELLAHGASWDEILADYSFLEREDIQACLDFAAAQSDHALIKVS